MRKLYEIDESFFDKIDSADKAYILGFIAADGHVEISDNKHYRFRFNQQKRDMEILYYIKKQLSYTGPIHVRGKYVYLEINNKHLVQALYKAGLQNNKALTLKPLKILKQLRSSFIRGLFDGDGCAAIYKRKTHMKPYIIFTGTQQMLQWVQEQVGCSYKLTKVYNSYNLNIGGFHNIIKATQLLNKSCFGLKRKTKVLDKIAAYCEKSLRKHRE
jgi:hypothetical protein